MSIDFQNDLVLITAAGGRQASGLLPHLVKKWKHLRLNVSTADSKERLQMQYPDAEVIQCDISDPYACVKLLGGVTACFLVTPGFHSHETECGYNIINAALENVKTGGPFKHMLHSSVIHPGLRKLINHDSKRYIEEYLIESGLDYTIIQPTAIMETFDVAAAVQQDHPTKPQFWDPSIPFSFVSIRDIGEAAAHILEQRGKHFYATYELVGTSKPISYNDVAGIFQEETGKTIEYGVKSVEQGTEMLYTLLSSGQSNGQQASFAMSQGVARMLLYYNGKGLFGNKNVLEMLLGRKALDYRDWVKLVLKETKGQ